MEAKVNNPLHHVSHAVPVAPYARRPPSPPFIPVPGSHDTMWGAIPKMLPAYENIDSSQLTQRDIEIITQNTAQVADQEPGDWSYEQRREAQKILDFLYLGPSNVIRDHAFLQRTGITLLLIARDARMASQRLMSAEKAVEALGIQAVYVDVENTQQLVPAFPRAVEAINQHLLATYHGQTQVPFNGTPLRRGKVLITCETGNDRSAAIAAAYIMAVYGESMTSTIRFMSVQRFCCCWDEDIKRKLQSWEDILKARSQVAAQSRSASSSRFQKVEFEMHSKRGLDDLMDTDDGDAAGLIDEDRFIGRSAFVPFVDKDG